jgi:hypothetical protein
MKHSIVKELYSCTSVLSIFEKENKAEILIEQFSNSNGKLEIETKFVLSKEELHSFIGTLLHVQSKLRK